METKIIMYSSSGLLREARRRCHSSVGIVEVDSHVCRSADDDFEAVIILSFRSWNSTKRI